MAEDWRTAYGRVKMELDEYRETIVPALMDKVRKLEKETKVLRRINEKLAQALEKMEGSGGMKV